jgi:hypothetical protein
MKRKLFAFISSLVVTSMCFSISAFADNKTNKFKLLPPDEIIAVIYDADGNEVNTVTRDSIEYQYSIPAGGSMVTYRYQMKSGNIMAFGFQKAFAGSASEYLNKTIKIDVYKSNDLGASGRDYLVMSGTFNTSTGPTNPAGNNGFVGHIFNYSPGYSYYFAKYTNLSSSTAKLLVIIGMW